MNFVHFCPMMVAGVKRACSQFCSHLMMVVLAVQAFLLKDVEAKEMACYFLKEMDLRYRGICGISYINGYTQ